MDNQTPKPEKGYLGNNLLKRIGQQQNWTPEQLSEMAKCMMDPIYFAENYIKIVHVDRGLIPLQMYDYQKEIATKIFNNRRVAVLTARQAGKCVHINTPIRLRNKKTGEVVETTVGEFYESQKIHNQNDSV
jgi:hypothetical protein